jgi:predicted lipoprotein with Yx(FWY)xxD motif
MRPQPSTVLVSLAAMVFVTGGLVASATAGTRAATVSSRKNSLLGEILVSAGGRALYHTAAEKRNVVKCTGPCAVRWLPLVIPTGVRPISGPGIVASMLGTVKRPDGRLQVTYHGFPLYLFSGDTKVGEASGQGVGGIWHAVAPSGTPVTKTAGSAPTGAGMPASPTTGSASSGGSDSSTGSAPPTGVNAGMWCAANPKSCVNGVPVSGGSG